MAEHEYEEGDTVYLPDGTKGKVYQLSRRSGRQINGIQAEFRGPDGWNRHWFDPEEVHHLSLHERLRRIEDKLRLDELD